MSKAHESQDKRLYIQIRCVAGDGLENLSWAETAVSGLNGLEGGVETCSTSISRLPAHVGVDDSAITS